MPKQDADTEQVQELADAVTAALAGDNTKLAAIIHSASNPTLQRMIHASALLGAAAMERLARNQNR